ncbi:MAG: hypothetical protein MJ072_02710, partial [Clostridia bacterium]|nr:hypothetical protein [Clostridia bacterium]
MFDWFWEFLYGISKSLFRLIDGLMACANMLCGIEPITVDDVEVDFLNYLVTHDRIMLAFEAATIIGVVLVGLFAIFAIIKSIVSEKAGMTPGQVFVKTFKTIFMFRFVPACMIAFAYFS